MAPTVALLFPAGPVKLTNVPAGTGVLVAVTVTVAVHVQNSKAKGQLNEIDVGWPVMVSSTLGDDPGW